MNAEIKRLDMQIEDLKRSLRMTETYRKLKLFSAIRELIKKGKLHGKCVS